MGRQSRARKTKRAKTAAATKLRAAAAATRSTPAPALGPAIIVPGQDTLAGTGPPIGHGPGGKPAVLGSVKAQMVCRYWRGGRGAAQEMRRLGFTEVVDPIEGTALPGENTLARDCGLGDATPSLSMFGICDYGDPESPKATLACHAAQAAGFTTTPCKHQKPIARDDVDINRALAEAPRIAEVMAASLRKKAGMPPLGRHRW